MKPDFSRTALGRRLLCLAAALCLANVALAADVAGAKDPSILKRYQGSEIVAYQTLPYESYKIAEPDAKNPKVWTFSPIEGQVTRLFYRVPPSHSVLEILRNYQEALREAGLTQMAERKSFADRDFGADFYRQTLQASGDRLWTQLGLAEVQQMAYVTAKGIIQGQSVTVAVFIFNYQRQQDVTYGQKKVRFEPDALTVVVDVVTAKALENKMVTVKAADMAEALASKGVISLYGIYFDSDKAEIKPESAATLDEVASLLKIDRSLKLEIAGHTDNAGTAAHNLKLSEARAQSVKSALVTRYAIDSKRLAAKGYGDSTPVAPNSDADSKAKNRRVELRKS